MALENKSTRYISMVFGTENGKTHRIELNNPRTDVTQTDVQTTMQMIIDRNIITTKNGNLVSIIDGGVIQRDYTDLIP
jgi:hypothetical protein